MIWIGIDPGLEGGVAIVTGHGQAELHDTPTAKVGSRRRYDEVAMADLLRPYAGQACLVVLEESSTRPGQSAQSGLSTGLGQGIWRGVLAALQLPREAVQPQAWKKRFGLIGADKAASVAKARSLFPTLSGQLCGPKGGEKDGRAEALLLAAYALLREGK